MISLTIDGQQLEVPESYTVLQAAATLGITIPTLCYHKDLSPFGGCRLCVVEVQSARLPMTSCILPVSPGLRVRTDTPELTRYRRAIIRMLVSNYYDAAYKFYDGKFELEKDSELAHWARVFDIDIRSTMAKKPRFPIDSDPNPFVWVDMNKCIQCTRCVRACGEIQGRFVWSQSYRGYRARIVAGINSTMLQSRCESCGACVAYCPTGALDNKMSVSTGRPDRLVATTCSYCSVGCQLDLNIKDASPVESANEIPAGNIQRVTSRDDLSETSVNGLHMCIKGRYGYEFVHHRRLTRPRVRQYLLDETPRPSGGRGKWVDVDWDIALSIAAQGLRKVRDDVGGEAVAVLASGRLLNEENYLLGKLARQALATNHIDCGAHVYSASVVDGLIDSLGLPAMSNSFDDIAANCRALFVIGSNLTEQHPVFGARIRQAILRRKVKLVLASPDFVNLAEYAALALYHTANSQAVLLNGLMHIILEKGWQDQASIDRHPHGFDNFKAVVDRYPPQQVAEITGVPVETLYQAAEILALNRPMAVLWSSGIADLAGGTDIVHNLANLQLLLGNLDVLGGGVNPLRSQNNTQGACDVGALPGMLPGYELVADAEARQKFEQAWGAKLPVTTGLKASEILAAAGEGRIKALYIVGDDILNTTPAGAKVRRSLETCDFVVLQEISPSDTARYADVLLPGVSFAEKTGTFTSSERRIQMVNQAIRPVGDARPDWKIISDLAQRLLSGNGHQVAEAAFSGWEYARTDQIMHEIAALAPIYAGVSHDRLENGERLQWPVDSGEHAGTPMLPTGLFSKGKAQWIPSR